MRKPQLTILAALICNKFIVAAALDELTVVEDGDIIAETAGGQAMADVNRRFIADDFIESGIYLIFGNRSSAAVGSSSTIKGALL